MTMSGAEDEEEEVVEEHAERETRMKRFCGNDEEDGGRLLRARSATLRS